jgi:hypothetical protein
MVSAEATEVASIRLAEVKRTFFILFSSQIGIPGIGIYKVRHTLGVEPIGLDQFIILKYQ